MNKVETTYGRQKVKSRNTKTIAAIAIILVVLGAGYVVARPGSSDSWGGMMGGYRGMMGYGNGTTAGYGGMMGGNGPGSGMMGYGNDDNGNDYCGAGTGYAGSGYGANATP